MKNTHISHFEYLPFLTGLEPDLINLLCRKAAVTRRLKKGDALFIQGDMSQFAFVIREGCFKLVWVNEDGKEVILQLERKGEFLGVNSIGSKNRHLTSAIALEDSRVCVISRDKLEETIREYPDVALQIICNLGNRLHSLSQQVVEYRIGSTRERVLNLLLRFAVENGEPCPTGTKIKMQLTQQDIANFIGASRVMVAQTLKQLMLSNYISRENKYYILNGHFIDPGINCD